MADASAVAETRSFNDEVTNQLEIEAAAQGVILTPAQRNFILDAALGAGDTGIPNVSALLSALVALAATRGTRDLKKTVVGQWKVGRIPVTPPEMPEKSYTRKSLLELAKEFNFLVEQEDQQPVESEDSEVSEPDILETDLPEEFEDDEPQAEEVDLDTPQDDPSGAEAMAYRRIADTLKNRNEANLEIGLFVKQRQKLGQTYDDVKHKLKQSFMVDLPNKSSVSRWGQAAEAWVMSAGMPLGQLAEVSVYKLYYTANYVTESNASQMLEEIQGMDDAEVKKKYVDVSKSGPGDFKNISLHVSAWELYKMAKDSFGRDVGVPEISHDQFIEFFAKLIIDTAPETRREFWAAEHGDEVQPNSLVVDDELVDDEGEEFPEFDEVEFPDDDANDPEQDDTEQDGETE